MLQQPRPPDVLHQVQGVAEASLDLCELLLALGRVPTQRQDVLQPSLAHLRV